MVSLGVWGREKSAREFSWRALAVSLEAPLSLILSMLKSLDSVSRTVVSWDRTDSSSKPESSSSWVKETLTEREN